MGERKDNVDTIRRATLDGIDRSRKHFLGAFLGAAALEAAFLAAFLLLADFSDRLHVLLLLSTVATYTLISLGLVALGAWQRRNTLLVLKAVEQLSR